MNINELRKDFDRDGYIVIENFFDDAIMDHLDGVIRGYYGENPEFWHNDEFLTKAKTEVVPWFPQREGMHDFDAIEQDERLTALSEAILGPGWNAQYCMVMFSKKGTSGQALLTYGDPVGEFEDQVILRPKKGTLVLLHGHTWHRVLPITGSYRFSTNYRSAPKGTPDDITDICVYRNMRYQFSTSSVVEERTA